MKKPYQHIIKKSYTTPVIEEVMIDVAINLQTPTGDPGDDNEETGDEDWGSGQGVSTYQPATFKSTSSPFPDSPKY